jgi:hypothetical protein
MPTKSKTITIIVIALGLAIAVFASHNENFVSAHRILTVQERYDSGYNDGAKYCGSGADIIDTYTHSSKYLNHSHLYQQGFDKAALMDCSKTLSTQNNASQPPIQNNASQPPIQNNTSPPTPTPTNKQGQANNQKVICVTVYGNCGTSSGQAQGINQQPPR